MSKLYITDFNLTQGDVDEVNGLLDVSWSSEDIGFGNIRFRFMESGEIHIESEKMGKKFIKKVLKELVNEAEIIE